MVQGALNICKHFAVHKCGHEKNPIAASKCLKSMIYQENKNNPDRFGSSHFLPCFAQTRILILSFLKYLCHFIDT